MQITLPFVKRRLFRNFSRIYLAGYSILFFFLRPSHACIIMTSEFKLKAFEFDITAPLEVSAFKILNNGN